MTRARGWAALLSGVIAASTWSCAGGQKLSDSLNDMGQSLDQTQRHAHDAAQNTKAIQQVGAAANDTANKCAGVRTQEIAYDEERTIGEAAAIQIAANSGGVLIGKNEKDPASQPTVALNQLGQKLASYSERPNLTWSFAILNSDAVNAYSAPGGLVFVTKGLLKKVENEAQLAGVLAHEIAHITGRHALNKYREVKEQQCKASMPAAAGSAAGSAVSKAVNPNFAKSFSSATGHLDFKGCEDVLANMGNSVAHALQHEPFDPKQEDQADYDGVSLLVLAGYVPEEYAKFLGALPDTFQHDTHPPKEKRVAAVHQILSDFAKDDLRGAGAPYGVEQGFSAKPVNPALASIKE